MIGIMRQGLSMLFRSPCLVCVLLAALLAFRYPCARGAERSGKLRVVVVDDQTARPLTARIVLKTADGKYPDDRIALSQDNWPNIEAHGVFVEGAGEFDVPPGKTRLRASCGPQYEVQSQEIEIVAGENAVAEFRLRRHIDLRQLGWVSGDAHVHMIHGEMQRTTSYADIAVTCRANGLDWAYINQEYGGAGELSLAEYHAECRQVSSDQFQLLLGGERPKSLLGHNALIGVANPFVVPDDPPYHRAARAIHEQGGVLFPVHPVRYFPEKKYQGQWLDFPGNNLGREIIFDAYLGPSFDGLSVLSDEPDSVIAHQLWFNLLNKGLFVPALADSDACFDRPTLQKNVPGFWATYLYVGPNGTVNDNALAEAVRRGQTMATTGPLVLWNIDGQTSGATLPVDGRPRQITIEVLHAHHNWTLDEDRISKVELIRNGELVRAWEPNATGATLSHVINEDQPCWYAVRARGTDARWQVAVASPIYFADERRDTKRQPLTVRVRGRVYDFQTGQERAARIKIQRQELVLKEFDADGQFAVDMPLDATISAAGADGNALEHDLLLDYAPVHGFLWNLDRESLGKRETLEQFESLVRQVDLEFPLGYRLPGCYAAKDLTADIKFESLRVTAAPQASDGVVTLATVLLDKRQVSAGDTINVAAVFHGGSDAARVDRLLVVEGRAYDPRHPTGFNPLKVFDTFESQWSGAADAGNGYRVVIGQLKVPMRADAGPVGAVEINAFSRGSGGQYESHIGFRLPIGPTSRQLMIVSNWPTVPISWHDHNYGIGPLKVCGKLGRAGQSHSDYRALHLIVATLGGEFDLSPARDCLGCADADDAVFTGHFLDQILNRESHLRPSDPIRPQPTIQWRDIPVD